MAIPSAECAYCMRNMDVKLVRLNAALRIFRITVNNFSGFLSLLEKKSSKNFSNVT